MLAQVTGHCLSLKVTGHRTSQGRRSWQSSLAADHRNTQNPTPTVATDIRVAPEGAHRWPDRQRGEASPVGDPSRVDQLTHALTVTGGRRSQSQLNEEILS
jgi:hypothetical protein